MGRLEDLGRQAQSLVLAFLIPQEYKDGLMSCLGSALQLDIAVSNLHTHLSIHIRNNVVHEQLSQ